ncbi:penicillin-binding protein 2 [candidate division GN15 bacterium]|nr:penicillin-binding protein 2 [candidate division GN15 bacterium]
MERFKLSRDSRVAVALLLVSGMILFLVIGLFRLQVLEHSELEEQSESNRIRVQPIIPRRGIVYDRDGRVIIDNRASYTVSVVPAEEVKGVTVPALAGLLDLDTGQVRQRIRKNMVSRYQPSPVKRDIPFTSLAILEEQNRRFPGVSYQMERVRRYADSLGAESFTGYVGEVSEEEMAANPDARYRLGSMIGKKGLERLFDPLLRGREGTAYIEVSASGHILGPYEGRKWTPAVPGSDLTLTIDIDLQKACVAVLDTFCCGAVVAIDPRNGEILAMTSYPGYDPNIFSSVVPESLWQEISTDTTHPLLNRPLNGLYPPGSTVKFVAIGAAIEEGLLTPSTTLKPCYGGMQFGNRYFRCWDHDGHGVLQPAGALEQSCDVYLYQVGLKLGIDLLADYYDRCGFGHLTNVDLPNESPGLNPNSEYYDERYGRNKWTRALVLNNAIGQGEILVTPLQLAQFFCGLANNGNVYRPHIIRKISHPSGEEITKAPEVVFKMPFSERTMEVLLDGLRRVVEGEHGTARRLRNKQYSIGGKTGTAQNPHGENHSLFVGVAPLERPEIVVAAIIENAGDGSVVAAPVVGHVIRTYMEKRQERQKQNIAASDQTAPTEVN